MVLYIFSQLYLFLIFLHYLNKDPVKNITGNGKKFVNILPHLYPDRVELPQGKFTFISWVIRIYAPDLIEVDDYFTVV